MVDKIGSDENFAADFSVSSHSLSAYRQQLFASACRGFTLVELIMVVAILGLLSAMAIPSFNAYVNSAKVAACAADIRTIEKGVTSYVIENNAMPANLHVAGMGNVGSTKDPWTNNYIYTPHAIPTLPDDPAALKDPALNDLNTDYDLYSMGANGVSALDPTIDNTITDDDIVRAGNGSFVGMRK